MRQNIQRWLAGMGGLAAAAMLAAPAYAVDLSPTGGPPQPPAPLETFANPLPTVPLTARERMTERVDRMSQRIQQDIGGVFPGEDTLGTGTSMTH
jgi:hypothetical protein